MRMQLVRRAAPVVVLFLAPVGTASAERACYGPTKLLAASGTTVTALYSVE